MCGLFMSSRLIQANKRNHPKQAISAISTNNHWLTAYIVKLVNGQRQRRDKYRLQEYDLEVVHVPRKLQIVVDGLSCLPHWKKLAHKDDGFSLPTFIATGHDMKGCNSELGEEWRIDPWYREIVCSIDNHPQFYVVTMADETILVYCEKGGSLAWCILSQQLLCVLYKLHDVHGHHAARITLGWAIGKYYWLCCYETICQYCNNCHECQLIGPKIPAQAPHPVITMEPFELFTMDYISPFNPPS